MTPRSGTSRPRTRFLPSAAQPLQQRSGMDATGRDATSPWQMPLAGWKQVAARTWKESSVDNICLIAAGVAFYGVLALVPLVASIVLCYGIFADPQAVVKDMQAL